MDKLAYLMEGVKLYKQYDCYTEVQLKCVHYVPMQVLDHLANVAIVAEDLVGILLIDSVLSDEIRKFAMSEDGAKWKHIAELVKGLSDVK